MLRGAAVETSANPQVPRLSNPFLREPARARHGHYLLHLKLLRMRCQDNPFCANQCAAPEREKARHAVALDFLVDRGVVTMGESFNPQTVGRASQRRNGSVGSGGARRRL
jgi:hypothetical protein